jgi:flagellin
MESAQGEHECHQGDARVSLEINTNIAATDAANNLSPTEPSTSQSIQRLSSGLRINSAADDAAGLAISENRQGTFTSEQILQQAGISMLAQAQKQPQAALPLLK